MSARGLWALCARAADLADAARWGLPAAAFEDAPWLERYSSAVEARSALAGRADVAGVWVASSDEVQPINLAAALKRDNPALQVFLVGNEDAPDPSRASAAGLDGVLGPEEFAARFAASSLGEPLPSPVAGDGPAPAAARPSAPDAWFASEEAVAASPAGERAATLDAKARGRAGFLLTVASGSGGTGKSTVSALLARLAERRGLRTALLDGDLQFGDLGELAGSCERISVEQVVSSDVALDEVDGRPFVLIAAPRDLERAETVVGFFDGVVSALTARFDLVVVNTGGSWGELHARLLEQGAASVLLMDQRASSVRACRHALDLCLRCGIATGSFLLALNRCGRHAPFGSADVSAALDGARVVELADGGREVEELLGAGCADLLIESGNGLCGSLDRVLDELLPENAAAQPVGREDVIARLDVAGAREREGRRSRKRRPKGRRERAGETAAGAAFR